MIFFQWYNQSYYIDKCVTPTMISRKTRLKKKYTSSMAGKIRIIGFPSNKYSRDESEFSFADVQ
jgi:hypothetical protein